MYKYLRWPNFKPKALTLSYDDGVAADAKMISIMSPYGIKGTFNINSGRLQDERTYFIGRNEIKQVYLETGNEVALHGHMHLSLGEVDMQDAIVDVYENRKALEKICDKQIRGMAYANDSYNDNVVTFLKMLGVKYARTTDATHDFFLPKDWLRMKTTCHHNDARLFELAEAFAAFDINKHYDWRPRLFYLWGHAYEFDNDNNWDRLEAFCKIVGNKEDIWYATNEEIYDYVKAYEALQFSLDDSQVYNPTLYDIYVIFDEIPTLIKAGETKRLK